MKWRNYIMNEKERDELFDKISKNKEMYKNFLKKSDESDKECHKYYEEYKRNMISSEKFMEFYVNCSRQLYLEKKELDLEWEILNKKLFELVKK